MTVTILGGCSLDDDVRVYIIYIFPQSNKAIIFLNFINPCKKTI